MIDPELYHELWKQEHAELMSKVLAATRRARRARPASPDSGNDDARIADNSRP